MQTVTPAFLAALRGTHTLHVRAEAWRNGIRVGGTLQVLDGQVEQAAGLTSSPRRTLNIDLAPAKGLWDALSPAGTQLKVWRGVRYPDGTTEDVPLGVFDVDEQTLGYAADGPALSITAPDLWVRVQRARFEWPWSGSGRVLDIALEMATDDQVGLSLGSTSGDSSVTVRPQVWERDRDAAIADLARAAGVWIYVDSLGQVICRPVPSLSAAPVWTVDASASGVLLDAERGRSRQRTYNVVVVSGGDLGGTAPFPPELVEDDDPTSPTYIDGGFGRVPYFQTSSLFTTAAQALQAGQATLRRVSGLAASLDLTSIVNPALEAGDVIEVLLPNRHGDGAKVERHIIDSVTVPLSAAGTQQIRTRSTRPEGDVPDEGG